MRTFGGGYGRIADRERTGIFEIHPSRTGSRSPNYTSQANGTRASGDYSACSRISYRQIPRGTWLRADI